MRQLPVPCAVMDAVLVVVASRLRPLRRRLDRDGDRCESPHTRIDLDTKTDMARTKATRTPTAQLMAHAQVDARARTQLREDSRSGPDRLVILQSGELRDSCGDRNPAQRRPFGRAA